MSVGSISKKKKSDASKKAEGNEKEEELKLFWTGSGAHPTSYPMGTWGSFPVC
jgi:hypothetical protein